MREQNQSQPSNNSPNYSSSDDRLVDSWFQFVISYYPKNAYSYIHTVNLAELIAGELA